MTRQRKYPKAVTIRMTNEMYAALRRLATDDRKVAGVTRQMIRDQLDERAELAGNRRHFTRRFRERMDELEENLELRFSLLTILLTKFEDMLIQLFEVSEYKNGPLIFPALFREAVDETDRYLGEVEFAIAQLRELRDGMEEDYDDENEMTIIDDEEDEDEEDEDER